MLYVSIVLLPVMLYAYFAASKPKRSIPVGMASPGSQLKERTTSIGREIMAAFFLGSVLAFSAAIIVFLWSIVADYRDSKGIFAVPLPAATFPPAPSAVYPPAPKNADQANTPTENAPNTGDKKDSLLPN
jgi:hypothetical protein